MQAPGQEDLAPELSFGVLGPVIRAAKVNGGMVVSAATALELSH
ncbi:MAG: hypothetical protein ACLP36_07850 [Acidimicrobiales bacterium]